MSELLTRLKMAASGFTSDPRRMCYEASVEIERLGADNTRLRAMMLEAAIDIESWGVQVDEYYQDKWDLPGDIEKYKQAAKGIYPGPELLADVDKFIADAVTRSEQRKDEDNG